MATEDRLTIARLVGTASRHVFEHTDHDTAVAELVDIATERVKGRPPRLRVDLLSEAAGSHIGAYRRSNTHWDGPDAARLLFDAGADPDQAEQHAADVLDALSVSARGGIGNST